jgi:DNA recombination protein RmuC
MTTISSIFLVLIAILVVVLIVLAFWWRRNESVYRESLQSSQEHSKALEIKLQEVNHSLVEERMSHVRTASERDALKQTIDDMRRDREQSETALKSEFKNLAQEILTEHQHNLRQTNRDSIDLMLKPFKDNITEFRERVERIYAQENEQRGMLKNELDNLLKLNQQMTSSAANLTDALKGNSKVQGDWGEVYLETILESTGLVRGMHYQVQQNFKSEDGANLRPDVVLLLPEDRRIIIDSKVSLTDYVRYTEAETEQERSKALQAHVESVRRHFMGLASKGYERLTNSPDFVVMFVPTEPAFLEALKADNKIWSDAYERKVIISSPTNLFALLKMVGDMWRRDAQSKNQAEIVDKATKLYEQLVSFSESLEGIGKALGDAKAKYDDAYKRMHTGNNNIVRLGERLKKLGLPTKKQQSAKALAAAEIDDEAEE